MCSMTETVKGTPVEVHNLSSIGKDTDLLVGDGTNFLIGILHPQDLGGKASEHFVTSDQNETIDSEGIVTCQKLHQSVILNEEMQKGLGKCATFPCSAGVRKGGLSIMFAQDPKSSTVECLSYARSISLPTSRPLVPATKGGRAQKGVISVSVELHVKWAPEVYDPPATSMSHTVKSGVHHSQRRPKAKKNGHKHKKSKGRLSSSSPRGERKNTGNSPNLLSMRLGTELLLGDRCKQPDVDVYDTVEGQESKFCGSSFLREGLNKVHLSIAEAS